jgi:PKD repeat protein
MNHANITMKNNIIDGLYPNPFYYDYIMVPANRPNSGWGQLSTDYNIYNDPHALQNPNEEWSVDLHSIFQEPSFVSSTRPFDFNVNAGSPAIDTGVRINNVNDSYLGLAPDIGKYEYADASSAENNAPALSSIGAKSVYTSEILSFNVAATDADGDQVTYSATGLPQGASLDSTTGLFYWIPSISQRGEHEVIFSATDEHDATVTETITITVNHTNLPPTIVPTASTTLGEAPLTVQFTAHAADTDGTIASYAWDFKDGATSTEANPSHIFSAEGNYLVSLTVTDNDGLTASDSLTVAVATAIEPAEVPSAEIVIGNGTNDNQLNQPIVSNNGNGIIYTGYGIRLKLGQLSGEKYPQVYDMQYQLPGNEWTNIAADKISDDSSGVSLSDSFTATRLVALSSKSILANQYVSALKLRLRVQVDDNISAYAETPEFALDNKNPQVNSVNLVYKSDSSYPYIESDASDDTELQMIISNNGDFSDAVWQSFKNSISIEEVANSRTAFPKILPNLLAQSTLRALAADLGFTDIFIRFKDAFGNQSATYVVQAKDVDLAAAATSQTTSDTSFTPASIKRLISTTGSRVASEINSQVPFTQVPNSALAADRDLPLTSDNYNQASAKPTLSNYSVISIVIYSLALCLLILSLISVLGMYIPTLNGVSQILNLPAIYYSRNSLALLISLLFVYVQFFPMAVFNYMLIAYILMIWTMEIIAFRRKRSNPRSEPPQSPMPPFSSQLPPQPNY